MKIKTIYKEMIDEYVSDRNMKTIEFYLDDLFASLHVDVEFSAHFMDRANDPRNSPEINPSEILDTFTRFYNKHKERLSNYNKDTEAVITNLNNDINVPFALNYNKHDNSYELMNKTIMRKKGFKSTSQIFKV